MTAEQVHFVREAPVILMTFCLLSKPPETELSAFPHGKYRQQNNLENHQSRWNTDFPVVIDAYERKKRQEHTPHGSGAPAAEIEGDHA